MNQCTVCKAFYEPGSQWCQRCGSDNRWWEKWQATHPEEWGGWRGLLAFTAPDHLPLFIILLTLGFGLVGLGGGGGWDGVRPDIQLLTVVATVELCLLCIMGVYLNRHKIREQQLLNQIRADQTLLAQDAQLRVLILPAFLLLFFFLLAFALVASDHLWGLARSFLFEPGYGGQGNGGPGARLVEAMPLLLMVAYGIAGISSVYASSFLAALRYARQMSRTLPQPIFLNEPLLTRVVKSDVASILGASGKISLGQFRRMREGGVELVAHIPVRGFPAGKFRIVANAWGRIQEVSQESHSDKDDGKLAFRSVPLSSSTTWQHSSQRRSAHMTNEPRMFIFEFRGRAETEQTFGTEQTSSENGIRESKVVRALNQQSLEIAQEIQREMSRLLPPSVVVQAQIEFYEGSAAFEGVIIVLDWMARLAGAIDLALMLTRPMRSVIRRVLRQRISGMGVQPVSPIQVDLAVPTAGEHDEQPGAFWNLTVTVPSLLLILTGLDTVLLAILLIIQFVVR